MKRIKLRIDPTGDCKLVTVEGAGAGCRAIADSLMGRLGAVDEGSRADTQDLYAEGDQHVEASH